MNSDVNNSFLRIAENVGNIGDILKHVALTNLLKLVADFPIVYIDFHTFLTKCNVQPVEGVAQFQQRMDSNFHVLLLCVLCL